jgi:hypothetical protein
MKIPPNLDDSRLFTECEPCECHLRCGAVWLGPIDGPTQIACDPLGDLPWMHRAGPKRALPGKGLVSTLRA